MNQEWIQFFMPYEQAVSELKVKLRSLRAQFENSNPNQNPIEFVTGRVKSQESIEEKMVRRHVDRKRIEEDLQDIAGVRVMTKYVEDVYAMVDLLRKRTDMKVLEERDYIKYAKPSGYRSYHMVVSYPVQTADGEKKVLAEIQIRTMTMNFWATVEHDLKYKQDAVGSEVDDRLVQLAESTRKLDEELSDIRRLK